MQQAGKDSQCSISALVQKPKGGDLNSEPTEALAWLAYIADGMASSFKLPGDLSWALAGRIHVIHTAGEDVRAMSPTR